jgi:hypothetical protein
MKVCPLLWFAVSFVERAVVVVWVCGDVKSLLGGAEIA